MSLNNDSPDKTPTSKTKITTKKNLININNKKKKNLKILPEYVWNFKNHKLPTLSNLGDEILSYIKGVDRINSSIQEKESSNTT